MVRPDARPVRHARRAAKCLPLRIHHPRSGISSSAPWAVSAEILQSKLAIAVLKRFTATQADQRNIVGRRRFDANDLVRRFAMRALENSLGGHLGRFSLGLRERYLSDSCHFAATQGLSAAVHDIGSEQHKHEKGNDASDLGAFVVSDIPHAPLL